MLSADGEWGLFDLGGVEGVGQMDGLDLGVWVFESVGCVGDASDYLVGRLWGFKVYRDAGHHTTIL